MKLWKVKTDYDALISMRYIKCLYVCRECGEDVKPTMKYCPACGRKLDTLGCPERMYDTDRVAAEMLFLAVSAGLLRTPWKEADEWRDGFNQVHHGIKREKTEGGKA